MLDDPEDSVSDIDEMNENPANKMRLGGGGKD